LAPHLSSGRKDRLQSSDRQLSKKILSDRCQQQQRREQQPAMSKGAKHNNSTHREGTARLDAAGSPTMQSAEIYDTARKRPAFIAALVRSGAPPSC